MKDLNRWLKGSMTVEMSFIMPLVLMLMLSSILGAFYFHDKNVLAGAAYETAVVGSTKMREKNQVTEGKLKVLFREREEGKCILFSGSSVRITIGEKEISVLASAHRGRFGVSVMKKAAVTKPEQYIRNMRRIEEIVSGAKNNN